MTQLGTSQNDHQDYVSIEKNLSSLKDETTPLFQSGRGAPKSQLLWAWIIACAVLLCVGLRLVFGSHLDHSVRNTAGFSLKNYAVRDTVRTRYDEHYPSVNPASLLQKTVLSPRLPKGKHYWLFIPLSSDKYQFLSWGSIDKSTIKVIPFQSNRQHIAVKVQVVKDPRNVAKVFKLPYKGEGSVHGIGIYAPNLSSEGSSDWPAFTLLVYIPFVRDQRRTLGSFETRLAQFKHIFPNLSPFFVFSRIWTISRDATMTFTSITATVVQVNTTSQPIELGSVIAKRVQVKNINSKVSYKSIVATHIRVDNSGGPVVGNLKCGNETVISSTGSKIDGEFTLTQGGGIVKLSTTNAPISGKIRLRSSSSSPRPEFKVEASNANTNTDAPIDLVVLEQPLGSALSLNAKNKASPVRVYLHPAFEGRLDFFWASLVKMLMGDKKDPAGRGRRRITSFSESGRTSSGLVSSGQARWGGWSDGEEHAPGQVNAGAWKSTVSVFLD